MTTDTFNPRTAKTIAAEIVDKELCGFEEDEMGPLNDLHDKCFAALGDNPAAVAAKLAELGIKGTRPDQVVDGDSEYGDLIEPEKSALAVYFRDVCGATHASFGTWGGQLVWAGTEDGTEVGHEDIELPEVLKQFQKGYEDFAWPALYQN